MLTVGYLLNGNHYILSGLDLINPVSLDGELFMYKRQITLRPVFAVSLTLAQFGFGHF